MLPPPQIRSWQHSLRLFHDMIVIGKEATIAFSAIDKLVAFFFNLEKAERKTDFTLVLCESQAKNNGLWWNLASMRI